MAPSTTGTDMEISMGLTKALARFAYVQSHRAETVEMNMVGVGQQVTGTIVVETIRIINAARRVPPSPSPVWKISAPRQ